MAYADFEYYKSEYRGSTIAEADFPMLSERASEYIDYITMGMAANNAALPQVKKACCSLAENYQVIEKAKAAAVSDTGELKSQSVGGWSQSYQTSGDVASQYQSQLYTVAQRYLVTTGLLYRGGGCACPCSPTL